MREPDHAVSATLGWASVWRWALWCGVLAGLGQALLVTIVRVATTRLILIGPDVVWMAPAADAAAFTVAALVAYLVTRRLDRSRAASLTLSIFLFLFLLGPLLNVPRLRGYAVIILSAGAAIQGARMLAARAGWFDVLVRRTLPVLVVLVVTLGLGLHLSRAVVARRALAALPPAVPGSPNVILIVLDTVRAESLSLYGYQRPTSPHLDEFARGGVAFERALASAPWTLPSHASFFTGRLPHELSADWLTPLDAARPTLAEAFASRGYVTVGFTANLLYTTAETGLSRGFLRYADFPLSAGTAIGQSWLARALLQPFRGPAGTDRLVVKKASEVNDQFIDWIASRPGKPFFAFLNYFDAHSPYLPPPPFDTKFGTGPQPDPLRRRVWSSQEIERSKDAYDGTLAYIDEQLGLLLDTLRTRGLLDNTVVVVTSDHGELIGEHGLFDHANSLYRPLLQVPLVVWFPAKVPAGVRVLAPVSLIDLPATLLDVSSVIAVASPIPGRSLSKYWSSSSRPEPAPLFAEISKGINLPPWLPASKGAMQSIVVGGMHYIRNGDGREELYDFEHDVAESIDLAGRVESRALLVEARRAVAAVLKPH